MDRRTLRRLATAGCIISLVAMLGWITYSFAQSSIGSNQGIGTVAASAGGGATGPTGPTGATGPAGTNGSGSPGGSSGQLQYNNGGAFGGVSLFSAAMTLGEEAYYYAANQFAPITGVIHALPYAPSLANAVAACPSGKCVIYTDVASYNIDKVIILKLYRLECLMVRFS
jgi:hypothetical protein